MTAAEFRELTVADAAAAAELEAVLFAGDSPWPASAFTPERHTRFFAARDEVYFLSDEGAPW